MQILISQAFHKKVHFFLLILAIICKTALCYYYFQLEDDKLKQVIAGKNLFEGHGLTINEVHINNLSENTYRPIIGWPPAYSVIFALFYIFIRDFKYCCLIIDFVTIIFFLAVVSRILLQLEFPYSLGNFLLLFFSLQVTTYLSDTTDLMAMAICLYSVSVAVDFFENKKKPVGMGILIGFVAVLPAFVRYMYIPISFVIPLCLLWNGIQRKLPEFRVAGKIALVIAATGIFMLLGFQKLYTGYTTYAPNTLPAATGFFGGNIIYVDSFLFSAVVDTVFLLVQASLHTNIAYASLVLFLRIIHWPLLAWLIYRLAKFIITQKAVFEKKWQVFIGLAGLVSLSVLILLSFLSVTHSIHLHVVPAYDWTYVITNRYYAFIMIIFPIAMALFFFIKPYYSETINKPVRVVFILLLSLNMIHGAYVLIRHLGNKEQPIVLRKMTNADRAFVDYFMAANKAGNIDVAVSGLFDTYSSYAVLNGGKGLYDYAALNSDSIASEKNIKILLITQKEYFAYFKGFLKKPGIRVEKIIDEKYFLSLFIPGNK